jgi:hypothetical protein
MWLTGMGWLLRRKRSLRSTICAGVSSARASTTSASSARARGQGAAGVSGPLAGSRVGLANRYGVEARNSIPAFQGEDLGFNIRSRGLPEPEPGEPYRGVEVATRVPETACSAPQGIAREIIAQRPVLLNGYAEMGAVDGLSHPLVVSVCCRRTGTELLNLVCYAAKDSARRNPRRPTALRTHGRLWKTSRTRSAARKLSSASTAAPASMPIMSRAAQPRSRLTLLRP